MSCDQVRPQLPDHVLGTLAEVELAAVRRHLRGCTSCRAESAELSAGVSLFARAAHTTEPPPELKTRVMAVLAEEWNDGRPKAQAGGAHPWLRWAAVAAAVVVLAGLLSWGAVGHMTSGSYREDALAYRFVLDTLGGTDFRVARLDPAPGSPIRGSALVYDSMIQQSWVGVLVRAPGYTGQITVTISTPSGRSIELPFPIELKDGLGDTWLATEQDLTGFDTIRLTAQDGSPLASCKVLPAEH